MFAYVFIVLKFDNRVDDGQLGENVETYDRIFQLLSTHRIIDAIQVAENAGITQLASLLTQLKSTSTDDDSFSVAMRNQLAIWVDTNEDALMADELVNVYRILASVPTRLGPLPDKMFPYSTLTNLGWSRSIGIFYWYCYQQSSESESDNNQSENSENLEPMASALLQYKLALTDGDVDYPAPRYMTQVTGLTNHHILSSVTTQQKYTDCLYNLLEVLFGSGEGVNGSLDGIASQEELLLLKSKYAIAAMESEACTTNTMDYRSSSLILILLQCCGMIPTDLNNTQASLYPAWLLTGASIVRQHIISQLLVLGYWKWAIFVCLLIEDPFQRNFLVSDIILRYSHLSTNANKQSTDVSLASQMSENDDNEILSNEDIQMLINEFHVPSEYIHQALGYYYGSIFNIDKQIEHYNFADMNIEANEVLCEKKAPKIIIEGDSIKMNHLLQLLEAMNVECMNELLEISEEESLSINLSKSELLLYYLRIRNDVDSDVWKDIITTTTATTTTTASDQYSSEQTAMIISVMKRASNLVLHIKKQYHQLILIKNKQKELINMSRDPSSYAYSVASAGVFEIACFHITSYLLEVLDQIHTTLFQRGSISGAVLTPTVYNLVFPPTATANSNSNTNTSIPVYDSVRMNCVLKESANIQKSSCEQVSNQIRSSLLVSCK